MRSIVISILFIASLKAQLVVSILDFKGEEVSKNILRASYKKLEAKLFETRRFTITAKDLRDDILKEAEYQYSGPCADECLVELGRQLGADYLVSGEIIDLIDSYQVNISITSMEKGTLFDAVEMITEHSTKDILNGIEELALEMTRRIASATTSQQTMQQPGETNFIQQTYGNIDIITDPKGADILIDLKEYGVTPKTIENIETGYHNLILNYPGYERLQKRIKVEEGQTLSISEFLVPKTGSLSILTEPSGASVYLDNMTKGQTPLDVFDLPVKDYIIRIELMDYQVIERRISIQYGENTTQKYDLEPLPGKLSLFTSPSLAKININGRDYTSGSNGIASIELPVGRYTLNVTKDGYEPLQREVSIKPNDLGTLDINLKRLPAGVSSNPDMGFLTVNTLDGKTKLKISGFNEPQRLPLKYFELKYGTYMLKAYGVGLETEKREVDIGRQKTTTIDINLKRKQRSKAIKYSLMFPGGGQFYEGSSAKFRGAIYASAFLGAGVLLSNGISTYTNETDLLDQYQLNYMSATSAADIDATWALYEKQSNTVNDAQANLVIISTTLVSAYLSSIIDSYFFSGLK